MGVAAWLRGLGLQQYEQAFCDNEIDAAVLPELTPEDLQDLGVRLVGHRRKLLAAITALRSDTDRGLEIVARTSTSAERRQLTVMFCDLVGSTALAARLDPEDLREVIGAYHAAVADVIGNFDGFVARYMGDGVLAYFGYPRAQEDDPERAVRAGLAVVEAVSRLPVSESLQVRIGLASGLAVVGDLIGSGAAREQTVVGETPNLAARLQALVEPDAIVIAENTRRLVGSLFEYQNLGEVEIKGLPAPVPAYRVLGESRVDSRFEALRSSKTPLAGRGEEIELLTHRWTQAKAGAGRVVLISGEPGIGKSRLTEAFRECLSGEPYTRLRFFCSPHYQDSPLFPFIGQLERAAGIEPGDSPAKKLDKLELLVSASAPAEGDIPLLAGLLSLRISDRYPALDLTPQRRKEKTFEALLRQLAGLARQQPVLMIFEDVHWADPTSRELLDVTMEHVVSLPVLLIITFRPELQQPWPDRPHLTTLPLRRLGREESDELVRGIVGDAAALPSEVVDEIVDRTDGVPLFLEELTKAVLENAVLQNAVLSGVPATSLGVPATLHASLMARLDRLGTTATEIAQVGAAIGRDFSYELLAMSARRTEAEVCDALARLVDAGLVFQRGVPPQATFLFKHALVQDTAYGMLLRRPRQALHAKIARALEEHFPILKDTQPRILAHHFTEAGLLEQAVAYWYRAGQRSVEKSALVEAIAQLRIALRLIADLPVTPERKRQELELQITIADALMVVKGYAHPEVAESSRRAHGLILETGGAGTIIQFSVLRGLWAADFVGGKPKAALDHANELLSLAQSRTDSRLLAAGHWFVGRVLITIGDYPAAASHLRRAVASYRAEEHRTFDSALGAEIGVTALVTCGLAVWHRGYPDQARKAADEALRRARQLADIRTLVYALLIMGLTAISGRQITEAEELANELIALSGEHRFELLLGIGQIFRGWTMAQQGESGAVERMRKGLTAAQATGWRNHEGLLGLLAEALALTGAIGEGLGVLAEALATAEASGASGNNAELHRLRGDLLRRLPSPDWRKVEGCFRTALTVARKQGTRGFELRAAVSLGRLLNGQGRRNEARDLLTPIYGWFTEGFDTPDLKEAKALLQALDA